jgi:ribonucleoside-diphosphate reductase alpha chain
MIKIRKISIETTPVYDITVPETECFFANDILVHNCQEIAIPVKPFKSVAELYKPEYQEGDGEIGLCSLAGIVVPNIESDEQYTEVAYYALKMIDVGIHKSDYVFPNLAHTAKSRLSAGVGIIGLAHAMAKNDKKYDTQDGRNFIHETAETHMWHLLNASLRLGKELGNAPWIDKTLWPQGWLPNDTYEKRVDELVTVPNKRDWEWLRKQIINNGGIRNSVIVAHMPSESSSISSGTSNGLYPIRDTYIMKTNDTIVNHWAAPDGTKLKNRYQQAWNISTTDMIKCYAIVQKWTDQTISADLFVKIQDDTKISSSQMIQDYLDMVKYGVKTRYYVNSLTSKGVDLLKEESAILTDTNTNAEDALDCESCKL